MTKTTTCAVLAMGTMGLGGCASGPGPLPLRTQPVPYADTLPMAEPEEREVFRPLHVLLYHVPLDMAKPFRVSEGEALNLTRFDDVVSSAWWERRMGYADLAPEDVGRGPESPEGAPASEGPLTITAGKTEGVTPGFTLKDAKGDTYIVKFDPRDRPHLQTAPGVITNRLMWGAGYHVPEDYILVFDRERLVLADDAEVGDRPMTTDDVEEVLAKTPQRPDGRFFALASKYVDGIPKGPFSFYGVRADDPNDHYAHQYRRDLRGLHVVSAWLNNTDMREGNTLDAYVEPGHLRHYIIDFGATLGSSSIRYKHPKDELEQPPEFWPFMARLVSLGFWENGWEDEPWVVADSAVGYLRAESFDPRRWETHWENPTFFAMTPADGYWGARIVSAFTDRHIRAAVEQGELPTESARDTLTRILAVRRDILVEHWFGRVTPVEEPEVVEQDATGMALGFVDLGLERGPWQASATRYEWSFEHDALDLEASGREAADTGGPQRIRIGWSGASGRMARRLSGKDALARLRIRALRPGTEGRAATVWLEWQGPGQGYRVVGLEH